jgi:hypothetical protein
MRCRSPRSPASIGPGSMTPAFATTRSTLAPAAPAGTATACGSPTSAATARARGPSSSASACRRSRRAGGQDHVVAGACERARGGGADPARGAGDESGACGHADHGGATAARRKGAARSWYRKGQVARRAPCLHEGMRPATDLGAFLRGRRAALTPADPGVRARPENGRPGLERDGLQAHRRLRRDAAGAPSRRRGARHPRGCRWRSVVGAGAGVVAADGDGGFGGDEVIEDEDLDDGE